jgi:hypothetical protein
MLSVKSEGNWKKTLGWLDEVSSGGIYSGLDRYGKMGVDALASATPVDTGSTASAWDYRIIRNRRGATIEWTNSNTPGGTNVAIILQYGHGTGTGGYVAGRDYINPAIRPVFDKIATEVWKKVSG